MQLGMKSDIEQLILPVRTELSSLKCELSASDDHMIQFQLRLDQHAEQLERLERTHVSDAAGMKSQIQRQGEKMQCMQHQVSGLLGIKSDIEQLILPVRTELSSLKSELSADHDHKTQVLEDKIKEQSERIDELMHQMEQMKVDSPLIACHETDFSSWISNDFVVVRDSIIQRIGNKDQKNYSFRSSPFEIDETIIIAIRKSVNENPMESVTFGVTGNSIDELVLQSLPENGLELQKLSASHKWNVAHDFLPHDSMTELIGLMRTGKGIVMRTASTETLLLVVDPFIRIFPFFLFDGSVEEIELKQFKVQSRTQLECLTCLQQVASTRAKPCGHLLFCTDCREGAILTIGKKCPLCGKDIVKYKQVPIN